MATFQVRLVGVEKVVLGEEFCDVCKDYPFNGLIKEREERDRPILLHLSRRKGREGKVYFNGSVT